MAIQELPGPAEGRRQRAARRGGAILDRLEELRLGLLGEELPAATLHLLQAELQGDREATGDPELDALSMAIELRAAVELAKLDASGADGAQPEP